METGGSGPLGVGLCSRRIPPGRSIPSAAVPAESELCLGSARPARGSVLLSARVSLLFAGAPSHPDPAWHVCVPALWGSVAEGCAQVCLSTCACAASPSFPRSRLGSWCSILALHPSPYAGVSESKLSAADTKEFEFLPYPHFQDWRGNGV